MKSSRTRPWELLVDPLIRNHDKGRIGHSLRPPCRTAPSHARPIGFPKLGSTARSGIVRGSGRPPHAQHGAAPQRSTSALARASSFIAFAICFTAAVAVPEHGPLPGGSTRSADPSALASKSGQRIQYTLEAGIRRTSPPRHDLQLAASPLTSSRGFRHAADRGALVAHRPRSRSRLELPFLGTTPWTRTHWASPHEGVGSSRRRSCRRSRGEADVTALPGKYLDLLTEGVDLVQRRPPRGRRCPRQVMLSAHRQGIAYTDVYGLLTDTEHRKLAHQLAHGKGGRRLPGPSERVPPQAVERHEAGGRRTPCLVEGGRLGGPRVREGQPCRGLGPLERSVMTAVLDLAFGYGTTQVAAPARAIAMTTGLGRMQVHRTLMKICAAGEWLRLAKRGNAQEAGRANLYNVAPALLDLWGASPPGPGPTYVPPTYVPG